ncbi:heterokaryon incompatibility protein-domain-containing protein [Chaetomium tenue]|uniref:Heterokaryon incompatibility protein-domain-containing protein n=1 Tax=Chaetomium tenue TaxID=1854479 RepID=A0ACB7NYL1_9PEZI|nr:heterokaryon incompatibility protein-domain-containing protein [Chaetomium globosum]
MEKLPETEKYAPFSYSTSEMSTPDTQFRLLELLPPTVEQDELSCRIVVRQLAESSRQYKALSYTWGNGSLSHFVAIPPEKGGEGERRTLSITQSLHTALVHLRHPSEPVWLWIDQICINQEDHAEKGKQVGIMGPIYAGAEQVLVWLGPAADDSDLLMDAWQSVGQAARDFGLESYYTKERWPLLARILNAEDPTDPKTIEHGAILKTGAETFAPLVPKLIFRHWFARPWFTRAWTVQEFCLCENTLFVCGTKTVPAELVMLAIQVLQFSISRLYEAIYQPAGASLPLLDELNDEPTGRLFSCRQRRRKHDRREPAAPGDALHALLRKLYVEHNTQAWLHRDRVFSLLGLAVDAPHLAITPDYAEQDSRAADARILARAARAMLTNPVTGRLDILSYAQPPKHPDLAPHLPSWAPDWRGNLGRSFYYVHEGVSEHLFAACGEGYLAVRPLPVPDVEGKNSSVVGLGGFRVDSVAAVAAGSAWMDMSFGADRFSLFFAQIDGLFERGMAEHAGVPELYGGNAERRAEAWWRVPTGDLFWTRTADMHRAEAPEAEVAHRQCREMVQFFRECETVTEPQEQAKKFKEFDWNGKRERGELGSFYQESMRYMIGKRPFLTSEGYLGMGPEDVKEGDMVVVLCGGRIPFILRPTESELELPEGKTKKLFGFVGEAYCDSAMDGEVVGKRELSEFYLI